MILCAFCGLPCTGQGKRTCSCRPPMSQLGRVVAIAQATARDRIQRGEGPFEVTREEFAEASAIARSTVEA